MAGKTPRFFRIATEGATSDGRTIDRDMLEQMAASYDPATYGARINLEHIRGYDPSGPFKAYGDVLALKTGKHDGKLALFAQLDPTPELVALTKARQKIYCSMEVRPDFADSGEAYLVGLAVTDNPASLGCEMLKFSATANANPLADRKQDPGNLFSEAVEVDLDFTPEATAPNFADTIRKLFTRQDKADKGTDARFADVQEAVQTIATQLQSMQDHVTASLGKVTTQLATLQSVQQTDRDAFTTLRTQLESTEADPRRPPATGGPSDTGRATETDC